MGPKNAIQDMIDDGTLSIPHVGKPINKATLSSVLVALTTEEEFNPSILIENDCQLNMER